MIPLNGNKETTQKSTYQQEIVSKINDIKELPGGTVTINLKLIPKYQRLELNIIAKYKTGTYHKGSFHGGSNIDIKLITCKDKIGIPSIPQSYILHWYHTYLLHPGMDRTEAMIHQYLYQTNIRYSVCKEVTNCDTCQRAKQSDTNMVNYQLS